MACTKVTQNIALAIDSTTGMQYLHRLAAKSTSGIGRYGRICRFGCCFDFDVPAGLDFVFSLGFSIVFSKTIITIIPELSRQKVPKIEPRGFQDSSRRPFGEPKMTLLTGSEHEAKSSLGASKTSPGNPPESQNQAWERFGKALTKEVAPNAPRNYLFARF